MFIHYYQRDKVAEAKILIWMFYGIGIPTYLYTMYINITTWKSDALFIFSCVLAGIETYWRIRKNKRADKKSLQEEIIRELEIQKLRKQINHN